MSYDIDITQPKTTTITCNCCDNKIEISQEQKSLSTNLTYNYSTILYKLFGDEYGIRILYGKTGGESISILNEAIEKLKDDITNDRYQPTDGNVKECLKTMKKMAEELPTGIWDGD